MELDSCNPAEARSTHLEASVELVEVQVEQAKEVEDGKSQVKKPLVRVIEGDKRHS